MRLGSFLSGGTQLRAPPLAQRKIFPKQVFRAECATLTLRVYSRGGGCGRMKITSLMTHTDVYSGLISSLLGQILSNATRNVTSTPVGSQIFPSPSVMMYAFPHNILPPSEGKI